MKVILVKNIHGLGKEGDVVDVKDGYARNYLLPQGIALPATEDNFKRLERLAKLKEKEFRKQKEDALKRRDLLNKTSITILAEVKDNDEIFGTVGIPQILRSLNEEKIILHKKDRILLEEPIRKLGVYHIKISLFPSEEAELKVWVVKK